MLQEGLPVCERPFEKIADDLGVSTRQVLEEIRQLKKDGIIRRFRAIINHHTLGKTGTLVTAHVPKEKLDEVTESVNALLGVSHNYLREHFYNLWFTLQTQSTSEIEHILRDLHERFVIDFHSMPIVRTFKLNVRFDVTSNKQNIDNKFVSKPKDEAVVLNEDEKNILSKLQKELEITEQPFSFLSGEKLSLENVLEIIHRLIGKGVVRRVAAVVDYKEVGFAANLLFACEVPQERVIEVGEKLARSPLVSHCYERKTFQAWPYNLFAMMHARSMNEINNEVNEFVKEEKIKSFQLLPTLTELKKEPVHHSFNI
jgi:DNA-binding Lrp family transcriptional regulator